MSTYRAVSPRRLTGKEEAELVDAAKRLATTESRVAELLRDRDRLIAEIVQAGARVTDVADVLNMSRSAVYDAVDRALGE